jgi:hypothetical protein
LRHEGSSLAIGPNPGHGIEVNAKNRGYSRNQLGEMTQLTQLVAHALSENPASGH